MLSPPAPLLEITVNGQDRRLPQPPSPLPAPAGRSPLGLLHFLRNDLGLNGPKYGCGLGECGACTVLVDGRAARACVIPAAGVAGRQVTTLEGLADHPLGRQVRQAFAHSQAAQCGYCLNGMVMMTVALLLRHPAPSDVQIRQQLSHNLCRCGTHVEILCAVRLASAWWQQDLAEKAGAADSPDRSGMPGEAAP